MNSCLECSTTNINVSSHNTRPAKIGKNKALTHYHINSHDWSIKKVKISTVNICQTRQTLSVAKTVCVWTDVHYLHMNSSDLKAIYFHKILSKEIFCSFNHWKTKKIVERVSFRWNIVQNRIKTSLKSSEVISI